MRGEAHTYITRNLLERRDNRNVSEEQRKNNDTKRRITKIRNEGRP
jgi:hypothetical protein